MSENDFYKQDTLVDSKPALENSTKVEIVPEQIGPYPIDALIEKGGMSLLYLARNPNDQSKISIKTLSEDLLTKPELLNNFFKEAEIIALADHPNIVRLYGHGKWERGVYIAMEFVKGISLRECITRQNLSTEKAMDVALQIASALCHLHGYSIIHRDLKPENILIDADGQVKVIDFGISQVVSDEENKEERQLIIGTPAYMSPEQAKDPSSISFTSDIYSLGIIIYELLTKKLSDGKFALEKIPQDIRPILEKSLKIDPQERYQDIVDLMMDLSGYIKTGKGPKNISPTKELKEPEEATHSELSTKALDKFKEHLFSAQKSILPPLKPQSSDLELGIFNQSGSEISGVYYDFFELREGSWGIIMAESAAKGIFGVVYTSVLRGMIRALSWSASKPVELVAYLNQLLLEDPFDQIFSLSYLIVYPQSEQLHYLSCGYGKLYYKAKDSEKAKKISAENIALGIDPEAEYVEISHAWNVGDRILLNTFSGGSEEELLEKFEKTSHLSPQEQTQALYEELQNQNSNELEGRPLTFISIERKN